MNAIDQFLVTESQRLGIRLIPRGSAHEKMTKYVEAYLKSQHKTMHYSDVDCLATMLLCHFSDGQLPQLAHVAETFALSEPLMK